MTPEASLNVPPHLPIVRVRNYKNTKQIIYQLS